MMWARPVSDWAACGRTEYLVEPVSMGDITAWIWAT